MINWKTFITAKRVAEGFGHGWATVADEHYGHLYRRWLEAEVPITESDVRNIAGNHCHPDFFALLSPNIERDIVQETSASGRFAWTVSSNTIVMELRRPGGVPAIRLEFTYDVFVPDGTAEVNITFGDEPFGNRHIEALSRYALASWQNEPAKQSVLAKIISAPTNEDAKVEDGR